MPSEAGARIDRRADARSRRRGDGTIARGPPLRSDSAAPWLDTPVGIGRGHRGARSARADRRSGRPGGPSRGDPSPALTGTTRRTSGWPKPRPALPDRLDASDAAAPPAADAPRRVSSPRSSTRRPSATRRPDRLHARRPGHRRRSRRGPATAGRSAATTRPPCPPAASTARRSGPSRPRDASRRPAGPGRHRRSVDLPTGRGRADRRDAPRRFVRAGAGTGRSGATVSTEAAISPTGLRREIFGFLPYWEVNSQQPPARLRQDLDDRLLRRRRRRRRQPPEAQRRRHDHGRLERLDQLEDDEHHLGRPRATTPGSS